MSVIDSKKKLRTYWDRLEAMSGEDIDYSNIPPMDQRFFTKCEYLLMSDHLAPMAHAPRILSILRQ